MNLPVKTQIVSINKLLKILAPPAMTKAANTNKKGTRFKA